MSTSMEQKIEGKEHFHGSDLEKIEKYFGIPKEKITGFGANVNPLGISLVGFLSPNGFHIFGVSKDNIAGAFQNVVKRNPILPGRFHTHILAVVFSQPSRTPA